MTKEEQLKIYSAYLPYKLQVINAYQNIYTIYGITNKMYDNYGNVGLLTTNGWMDMDDAWENKPILYDMSYLTKEVEHEGERFMPVEKLMKMRSVDPNSFCCEKRKQKAIEALLNDMRLTDRISIDMYNKLLEWHFNVFNLPESEYINKATLTNK